MTTFTDFENKQIDELHQQLIGAKALEVPDLCTLWSTVRPFWSTIIAAAAKIPGVGWLIAAILGAFGKALDGCCPQVGVKDAADSAEHGQIEEAYAAIFSDGAKSADKPCCNIWKKAKTYWPKIIAVVKKFSPKLADILQKIGDALDKFCG